MFSVYPLLIIHRYIVYRENGTFSPYPSAEVVKWTTTTVAIGSLSSLIYWLAWSTSARSNPLMWPMGGFGQVFLPQRPPLSRRSTAISGETHHAIRALESSRRPSIPISRPKSSRGHASTLSPGHFSCVQLGRPRRPPPYPHVTRVGWRQRDPHHGRSASVAFTHLHEHCS